MNFCLIWKITHFQLTLKCIINNFCQCYKLYCDSIITFQGWLLLIVVHMFSSIHGFYCSIWYVQHTLSDNYIGYIVAISCTLNFTIWRNIARQNVLITDKNSKWGVLLENSGPELSRTFLLLVFSFVGVFVCIELTRHKNWSCRDCQRSLEERYGCCFQEP